MSQVPSTSTSSTTFETIFTAALKEYAKKTKKDIASHPLASQLKSCESPNAILAVLQTQVQTFDQSESANERWTKLLDPTVNVLYAFSGFLSNVTGPILPPAAAIFTGVGLLLQTVKDVRASQDILIEIFGRMEFFFKRLETYIKIRPSTAMTDIIVKIMVEVISILGFVTKELGQGRIKKYLKRLFGLKRIEDMFQRLDKLTQEEARMAAAETLRVANRIDENVIRVGENVDVVNKGMQQVHMEVVEANGRLESVQANVQDVGHEVGVINKGVMEAKEGIHLMSQQVGDLNRNESRKDLRTWVAPPDPSSNFDTASGAHLEGTSAWCTKGNTLEDWKTSGSLFWIHGKPGSGKTILSSVIIRNIKPMAESGLAFLAYFYFDFKDRGKQDSRALLSSLLIQLSNQSDHFCDILRRLYSENQDGSQRPDEASLLRCLEDMLMIAGPVPVYLVLDALDECPNDSAVPPPREKVLELVKGLVELRHPNMRLCITSRPEFDIRTTLEPLATQEISLHDQSGQNQDIIDYVTSVVQSEKLRKRWRDDDKKMVIDKLTEKADGMFRWVYCQLVVLQSCFPNNLRRTLEELPKSLDETYKRILNDINNSNQKEAHRLLQCLAVARRPLRVEELAEVLALDVIEGGTPTFNANWLWQDHEEAVLSACSSLVSVIVDNGSRVVQFSHFSVKEYLASDRLASCMEDISQFHITTEPSHTILAQACLGVLLCLDDRIYEDSVETIPLYQYAAEYWVEHAQVGSVELQIKDAVDCFFDLDNSHFATFFRLNSSYFVWAASSDEEPTGLISPAAPLCVAIGMGLSDLAGRLISKRPQVVNFCGRKGTPLHLSVGEGNFDIARLLLAHGADINSRSTDNSTPLHIALEEGHLDIGAWLLDSGADVNAQDEDGSTPLLLAAYWGHAEVCRMLLGRNADVHVRDNRGNTPISLAASEGRLEIARMLLKYNAEVNSQNDEGSTPCLVASTSGNFDVVRLLLDHSADVHVHDNDGNTPLHFAASRGHLTVARILLERHAMSNSRNNGGLTPFLCALKSDNPDIARLLLDHDADVQVHDNSGNTSLHFAASGGHLEIARTLLAFKAEVDPLNDEGLTPLLRALQDWRKVNPDITRLLLDYGANVNVRDNHGNTPLHFATFESHLEVARMLLESKADVNSQNDDGSTPLLKASEDWRIGNLDIVRLLLDYAADVNARDKCGDTPLYVAASGDNLPIAQMLLERNANVNFQNDDGYTPVYTAFARGSPDIARLLLEHSADVLAHDQSGKSLLHFAVSRGQLELATMLLKLKARVNFLDDYGSTPLHRAIELDEDTPGFVRLLLDYAVDVRVHDNSGNTPLHLAAFKGDLEVVRMLLEQKANVNALNNDGSTPMHRVSDNCLGRCTDVVRLLLDYGADVHVHDNSGNTPLHFSAFKGHLVVSRMLLERKAEVNAFNNDGSTPIHQASEGWEEGCPDAVRLLLNHGADVNMHDKSGNTPLHLAAFKGDLKVARVLLELKAEVDSMNDDGLTPLHRASQGLQEGHRDIVRLLLGYSADVDAHDKMGNTPLHLAATASHLKVIRILLECHAEVNPRNDDGSTPFLRALENDNADVARLLLEHDADLHVHDSNGNTPLHCAASGGHLQLARALLELNADVNSLNDEGSTPLHRASDGWEKRNVDVVRLLLDHGADAQIRNLSGLTASEVAHERENHKIVRLLAENADI